MTLAYLLEPYIHAAGHLLAVVLVVSAGLFGAHWMLYAMGRSAAKQELRKFQQSVRAGKGLSL